MADAILFWSLSALHLALMAGYPAWLLSRRFKALCSLKQAPARESTPGEVAFGLLSGFLFGIALFVWPADFLHPEPTVWAKERVDGWTVELVQETAGLEGYSTWLRVANDAGQKGGIYVAHEDEKIWFARVERLGSEARVHIVYGLFFKRSSPISLDFANNHYDDPTLGRSGALERWAYLN